jgi:hypothetical protein
LAFLSSGALVIVAMTGRDPLLFGVGLFTMISKEVGLFSLVAQGECGFVNGYESSNHRQDTAVFPPVPVMFHPGVSKVVGLLVALWGDCPSKWAWISEFRPMAKV